MRAGAARRGPAHAAHEPAVYRPAGRAQFYPADAPLPRERAKAPYSPAEIGGYLALADAQPVAERRMRAAALICLGAGAGLIRGDLRQVRGTDVTGRSGGVIVQVRGGNERLVPVLDRYHARLLAGGGGLPKLDTSRLRATWLRDCAGLLGLATFMHAAGISCSQRLGDLVAGLEPGSEADAVRLLGGTCRR